jgi:hypothetical protein
LFTTRDRPNFSAGTLRMHAWSEPLRTSVIHTLSDETCIGQIKALYGKGKL